jgi:ABC-type glutathione transport system ATPase component
LDKLLEVKNLNIDFLNGGGYLRVVSELSFSLGKSEALGIVGESEAERA